MARWRLSKLNVPGWCMECEGHSLPVFDNEFHGEGFVTVYHDLRVHRSFNADLRGDGFKVVTHGRDVTNNCFAAFVYPPWLLIKRWNDPDVGPLARRDAGWYAVYEMRDGQRIPCVNCRSRAAQNLLYTSDLHIHHTMKVPDAYGYIWQD
jgi:hypothetical protein